MKISAAYLRMSTDKQEYSIESQLRMIKNYAERNDFIIKKIYTDEGISGRYAQKRPSFLQMIDDSSKGIFEQVLIYDTSRFARNLEQFIVYKSILKRNGVELISITEPVTDDDTSLITDALLGAMNEMYSRKLSKNVKRGMEQKALRGEYLSAAPFGYKKEKNLPLKIVSEEAEIVKLIFELYSEKNSLFCIARRLNFMGVKTKRKKPVTTRWIKGVLTNITYKGYLKWHCDGKEIIKKSNHIPIISEVEFDRIQELIKASPAIYKVRPAEAHKHWLIGILKCSECGSSLVYAKAYGGRSPRFRCGGYSLGKCKTTTTISVPMAEELILNEIKKYIPKNRVFVLEKKRSEKFSEDNRKKEISALNAALIRAKNAYLYGTDTLKEYQKTKEKLSAQIKLLNEYSEKSTKSLEFSFNDVFKVLCSENNIVLKNKIVSQFISKILFNGKERVLKILYK